MTKPAVNFELCARLAEEVVVFEHALLDLLESDKLIGALLACLVYGPELASTEYFSTLEAVERPCFFPLQPRFRALHILNLN